MKKESYLLARTVVLVLMMLMAPTMILWAQEMNKKFSMTTQMFLNELKEQAEHPTTVHHRAPEHRLPDGTLMKKLRRLIASPDTVGGVAYISCFIHLKDFGDQDAVRALGVEVEETFDGLDFVTAHVPVDKLYALADIDNVTQIKVAQLMRPLTDASRQFTNVDDLLTLSNDAIAQGVASKYDGTGVVLGIIDTGIDFQHIAFQDKDGNSRIKGAYVYNGSSAQEYNTITSIAPTTDDEREDHGTHVASTAGGSSVIVNGSDVTVTNDHANATYGGMAPGADLYLASIKDLSDTYLSNALKKMVAYADAQGQPLVVNNSWGSQWGPHNGIGEWASLVANYFGDSHPNHIILFASSNDAGNSKYNEGGGFFVKKSDASASSPLGTIIRSIYYYNADGGFFYSNNISTAWAPQPLNCSIHVLNNSTGEVLQSWNVSSTTSTFSGLSTYYTGILTVEKGYESGSYYLYVHSDDEGLKTTESTTITQNGSKYHKSNYILAIEVYPTSGSTNVEMWPIEGCFFTNHLTSSDHIWIAGTDDMCVSDEATIPDAISVGAYASKKQWNSYSGQTHTSNEYTVGDIASFSSYATAEQSPTGVAYPWITAPGARLVAGVNHYHTPSVDKYSYYGSDCNSDLVVNNANYPYAMMEGTSMATPVAAGIVALWLQAARSENMELTVNDVKDIMAQTAIQDEFTSGPNASHFGHGKIDALAGIQRILQMSASVEPTPSGETLLYEGLSKYKNKNDGTGAISTDNTNLDSDKWGEFKYVYPGGTDKAFANEGCIKLGNANNYGMMTTKEIALYGNGTLTFHLKKYGSDTGKLNVTVTGATADKASFTPQDDWTLCTVKLTNAKGKVTISFATSAKRAYIDEITLIGGISLALADNGSNSTAISKAFASHGKYDVTMSGRTLYKDGEWNTLCLPFDVTLAGSPLDGAIAKTLTDATMTGTTVSLTFGEAVTTLQAGVPYIIKWEKASGYDEAAPTTRDITSPVFANVTVKSGTPAEISKADGHVKFIGYYDAFAINPGVDDAIYYMTTGNTLMHTGVARTLNACRAYFRFSEEAQAREFVLNFVDDTTTSIHNAQTTAHHEAAPWYDLQGRRISSKFTVHSSQLKKGLYIQNGKKVVIK